MSFFYERIETEKTVTITYKNMLIYYAAYIFFVLLAMGSLILMRFVDPIASCCLGPFAIIPLILLWLHMRQVGSEVKEAMRKGSVKVSGSRFSSSNPLTYVIEKPPAEAKR